MRRADAIGERGVMSKNVSTIQNIYAAFARGDIPSILEHVADDCIWEYGLAPNDVPWLKARTGRSGAAEFFQTLVTSVDVKAFSVPTIVETEKLVIALVQIEFDVKRTGKTVREDNEVHLWHFDDKGRVIKFRHCVDTLQHQRAVQA